MFKNCKNTLILRCIVILYRIVLYSQKKRKKKKKHIREREREEDEGNMKKEK